MTLMTARLHTNADTIAAIATPAGSGGIAIVRISGGKALDVFGKVFRKKGGNDTRQQHRLMSYGFAVNEDGEAIDEVMAVFFKGPHSYTAEDAAEIHCHGGSEMARLVLSACMAAGARLAQPGEFTKRAFLNGRIDLAQAESVMRLISARSEKAALLSRRQLGGELSMRISSLQDELLDMLALIEAAADYPDDDIGDHTANLLLQRTEQLLSELNGLLARSKYARTLSEGIRICIAGRPNAGKSSLMNALLGQNRAIVTDIAGTTRDILTEPLNINGIPAILCDTAGLRSDGGVIERIGIERAKEEIEAADLILLVQDMSWPLSAEDRAILSGDRNAPVILVRNKSDLFDDAVFENDDEFSWIPSVTISALRRQGIDDLRAMIAALFEEDGSLGDANLTEERHVEAIGNAKASIALAKEALESGMPVDICSIDLRDAWRYMGLITGKTADDDLISRIFENFCLGK